MKNILTISLIFILSGCWLGGKSFLYADNSLPDYAKEHGNADEYKIGSCVAYSNAQLTEWAKSNPRPLSTYPLRGKFFNQCMEDRDWD